MWRGPATREEDMLRPYFSRGSIVIFIDWIPRSPGREGCGTYVLGLDCVRNALTTISSSSSSLSLSSHTHTHTRYAFFPRPFLCFFFPRVTDVFFLFLSRRSTWQICVNACNTFPTTHILSRAIVTKNCEKRINYNPIRIERFETQVKQ